MGIRIDKLLGKSPFLLVQEMMSTTNKVVFLIPRLFEQVKQRDLNGCQQTAREISEKEGEIDQIKLQIRTIVAQSLFFPFPKRDFLELIFTLDGISDRAEILGKIFALRELHYPPALEQVMKNMLQTLQRMRELLSMILLDELSSLAEASFSGPEAQSVLGVIEEIARQAHALEQQAHDALVVIFQPDSPLEAQEIILWNRIIDKLEAVGLALEKSATTLRMLIEK